MIFVLIGVCTLLFSVMGKNTAILEIVLYETTENGGYKTKSQQLYGYFSPAGTLISAEGRIMQLHPLGLCNTKDYDELYQFGWVGVVKLEKPELEPDPCLSVFDKAGRALQRGATAVIFDISDNLDVAQQLQKSSFTHSRPVILVRGIDADRLMKIVNTQDEARVRVTYSSQDRTQDNVEISHKEYYDMGIFVAVFIIFCFICVFVILRLKYRHRDRQLSESCLAKRAIAKMETRKYKLAPCKQEQIHTPNSDSSCYSSTGCENCAICLEGYQDGQVLRVLPCSHEFHRKCVDTWLLSEGRCPLCNFKITAQKESISATGNVTANPTQQTRSIVPLQSGAATTTTNSHRDSRHYTSPYNRDYTHHNHHTSASQQHHYHHHHHNHQRRYITCPSCEGTAGSSSTGAYIQDRPPSGCSNLSNLHYQIAETSNKRPRTLLSRPVSAYIKKSLPSPYSLSPYSCQVKHGCQSVYVHNSTAAAGNFNRYSVPSSKRDRGDIYQDYGNLPRSSSIIAVRGSSSSDPNPSDSSVECECLKQTDTTQIDSNKSTYGSSDVKDISDTSSNDSNIYSGTRLNKSDSEDLPAQLPQAKQLRPSCMKKRTSGVGFDLKQSTRDPLEYDDYSSSSSSDSSSENEKMEITGDQKTVCSVCRQSGYSNIHRSMIEPHQNSNYYVPSQALIKSYSSSSYGASCQTKGLHKKQPRSVISLHRSHTFSTSKEIKYTTTGIKSGKSYVPLNQRCVTHSTSKTYSEDRTVSNHSAHHSSSSNKRYSLAVDYQSNHQSMSSSRVTSVHSGSRVPAISSNSGPSDKDHPGIIRPTPFRASVCEMCHQSRSIPLPLPRRSMVLFTEPQGGFITIPLSEQEVYNPSDVV